jgi:hypothetical protein
MGRRAAGSRSMKGPAGRTLVVTLALAASLAAQDAGQTLRGEITAVALKDTPRRVTVRLEDGSEVEATLADRARVTFKPGVWRHPTRPQASDLQRGMTVEFKWAPQRVAGLHVLAVPETAQPGGGYDTASAPSWGGAKGLPAYEAGRELRGRVVSVNVAGGTLTVAIEGREQAFLADPRDLRALTKGAQVVMVTGDDGRLVSVRPLP